MRPLLAACRNALWWLLTALASACEDETPRAVHIAGAATLLFYNSPAAVFHDGSFYVGYIRNDGLVEVVRLSEHRKREATYAVRQFKQADDHLAPALWVHDGRVLVASAGHGGDMHLYSVTGDDQVVMLCEWKGRFTYPRFDSEAGQLRLYVRSQTSTTGHLVRFDIGQGCSAMEIEREATQGHFIYATPRQGRFAWSLWRKGQEDIRGVFVDGHTFEAPANGYPTTRAWSVAGSYLAVSHSATEIICCGRYSNSISLYDGRNLIYSDEVPTPYYPNGIVISALANEALIPVGKALGRRSLPSLDPLTSCPATGGFDVYGQYVLGGSGSYVWTSFEHQIDIRNFPEAQIWLCVVPSGDV